MTPSNEALLREATRPLPFPPQNVCRKFYFPHGIPAEYYSFTDREDYRKEKGRTIEQVFTLSAWRALAAEERQCGAGHALSGAGPEYRFVS